MDLRHVLSAQLRAEVVDALSNALVEDRGADMGRLALYAPRDGAHALLAPDDRPLVALLDRVGDELAVFHRVRGREEGRVVLELGLARRAVRVHEAEVPRAHCGALV